MDFGGKNSCSITIITKKIKIDPGQRGFGQNHKDNHMFRGRSINLNIIQILNTIKFYIIHMVPV